MTRKASDILKGLIEDSFETIRTPDVKCIKEIDLDHLTRVVVLGLQWSLKDFKPMTNTAMQIGKQAIIPVGPFYDLTEKELSLKTFKVGYHFLHLLAKANVIDIARDWKTKRDEYKIYVKNVDLVDDLIAELGDFREAKITLFNEPQFVKPQPFRSFWHPKCGAMVRNTHPEVYKEFTPENTPVVFDVINKLMGTAYAINEDLLDVFSKCQQDDLFTFADKRLKKDQLTSKLRDYDAILTRAEGVVENGNRFWQYMYFDWRGRVYPATSYLNHAGSKLAKALIMLHDKEGKKIGEEGYFFLLVHASNTWGYDKASIDGRYDFADRRLNEWLEWAKDPVNNKGWQKADSPFEFLAAIMEIAKSHAHNGGPFDYESGLLVAWDASCSGLQVLSALCRDRHSAELCNIAVAEKRGDYYKMIADHVWEDAVYEEEEVKRLEEVMADIQMHEDAIEDAKENGDKELVSEAYDARAEYSREHGKEIYDLARVYWGRPEIAEKRRKICKRSCMTYFYSCGEETMAEAVLEDFGPEEEFAGLNMMFSLWLTKRIFKACQTLMPKPTELMKLFVKMGLKDYNGESDFFLEAPFTKFKLVQYYRLDNNIQVKVNYKGRSIRPRVVVEKLAKRDHKRVKSGSAPNVVHMLDAVIVAKVIMTANDYEVSCVHDSFAASVADAGKLFEDTRTSFYELFKGDVLTDLLDQKFMENDVEYGDLAIAEVFDNEQCFS